MCGCLGLSPFSKKNPAFSLARTEYWQVSFLPNDKEEMFLSFSLADMVLVIQLMDISLLAKISCFYVRSMVKRDI